MHHALRSYYYSQRGRGYSDFYNASLNSYSDKVYYQHRSSAADNYIRIWSPINDTYAQYWDIRDHDSTTEDYINFGRGGVVPYYQMVNHDTVSGTLNGPGTSTSYLTVIGSYIEKTFFGSGVYIKFFSDNRGGMLRVSIDGVDIADVSTYSASGLRNVEYISDVSVGVEHTIRVTYIGDDPSNVPSGGAGTSRGWIATDNSTSGALTMEKAFWIVGSPTPNSAYPWSNDAGGPALDGIEFVGFSYKPWAFSIKKSGSVAAYNWIPNHNTTGNATTFATLATDRTLKADGGANLLDTFTTYTFGVECDSIVLSQTFQGHNSAETAEELIQVTETLTFTKDGVKIEGSIEQIQAVDHDISYISMFPNNTAKFDTLIYKDGEIDTTITDGTSETLYSTANIGNWDGNAVYVDQVGTDTEQQYSLAYKLVEPSTSLKVGTAYGQYLFLQHRDATLQKMYPTVVDGPVVIPSGVTWTWTSYLSCQMISGGAYSRYR